MAKVVVGMSLSLDGFVNDRHGSVERLYPDLAALRKTVFLREVIANTGAVVMGRRAYDMADGDFTGYESRRRSSSSPIALRQRRPEERTRS